MLSSLTTAGSSLLLLLRRRRMCYAVQPYHSGKFHKGDETAVVQDEQLQHNSVMFQVLVHSHIQIKKTFFFEQL